MARGSVVTVQNRVAPLVRRVAVVKGVDAREVWVGRRVCLWVWQGGVAIWTVGGPGEEAPSRSSTSAWLRAAA